jgi:Divergent InlB B-repeat domain
VTLARFAVFLAAATAAVAAWPSAGAAATVPTTWCGTEAATADRKPDQVAGHQIAVVYAHPLGSPDNFASVASKVATDLATVDAWWRAQDPTRTPRFDRFAFPGCATTFGSLDLARVTLPRDATYYAPLVAGWERISDDVAAPPYGFSNRHKKYLVYYDGPRDDEEVCGIADGNPFAGSSYAQVYLQACFRDVGAGRVGATTAAHELMHTLGAVPAGAPHSCFETGGHVCDRLDDVMYPSVADGPLDALILDPGRDDYYGHSGSWFDLQDSFWLARLDAPQVPLTVSVSGPGRVASDLPGIDCPGACSIPWDRGSRVPLVATPEPGARFVGWKGACSGRAGCSVALEAAATVTASFTRAPAGGDGTTSYRLSVSVSGSGRVLSTPSGISCTRSCAARFGGGSSVSLRAVPGKGWRFAGWGAPCSHGASTCTIPMRSDRGVRAAFARR